MKLFTISLCIFFFASPAYAYIDPGTGSIFLQGLIAAFLSLSFTIKTYWYKIKSYFIRSKNKIPEKEIAKEE